MDEKGKSLIRSEPHIIERILCHFSAREILRVTRVCRTWRKSGATVLKKRNRVMTMVAKELDQFDTTTVVDNIVDNPETQEFLRNLDMECGLVIMFNQIEPYSPSDTDHPCVANFVAMRSCLPPSFTAIGARSDVASIGTSTDGSLYEWQSSTNCLSAYLLPKSPPEGTHITHFSLSSEHVDQLLETDLNMAALAQAFRWPSDQAIKCIVLLASDMMQTEKHLALMSGIQTVCESEVALVGGVSQEVYSSAHLTDEREWLDADAEHPFFSCGPMYVGLLFGGENVRAASLVIEPQVITKEDVEKRLKELKAVVEGWGECKQKIGFMFGCCGRGYQLFGASDMDPDIFHQLMPNIPLNGMYMLYGHFGWDYPPPVAIQPAKKQKLSNDALLDDGTTTIAVVGFV